MTWLGNCALTLAFVCAPSAFAQGTACLHRTVPLGILSAPGTPVAQITSSDLRAEFHGKPAQILGLSSHVPPHRVLILLDASASMRGPMGDALWPAAVYVAGQFAESNLPALLWGSSFSEQGQESRFRFLRGMRQSRQGCAKYLLTRSMRKNTSTV